MTGDEDITLRSLPRHWARFQVLYASRLAVSKFHGIGPLLRIDPPSLQAEALFRRAGAPPTACCARNYIAHSECDHRSTDSTMRKALTGYACCVRATESDHSPG